MDQRGSHFSSPLPGVHIVLLHLHAAGCCCIQCFLCTTESSTCHTGFVMLFLKQIFHLGWIPQRGSETHSVLRVVSDQIWSVLSLWPRGAWRAVCFWTVTVRNLRLHLSQKVVDHWSGVIWSESPQCFFNLWPKLIIFSWAVLVGIRRTQWIVDCFALAIIFEDKDYMTQAFGYIL